MTTEELLNREATAIVDTIARNVEESRQLSGYAWDDIRQIIAIALSQHDHDRARLTESAPGVEGRGDRSEAAPPNNLPTWQECQLRVANSDSIAKRVAEGGYGGDADIPIATQLHRFIYEYDDADPYRSAWFLHRLELLLKEAATPPTDALAPQSGKKEDVCVWTEDGGLVWATECGQHWAESSDCDPIQEWMECCFKCGKRIEFIGEDDAAPSPPASKAEGES